MEYYVECPYEITFLELRKRFINKEGVLGYTIGYKGGRFVTVNYGSNHKNEAFGSVINIFSADDTTCGRNSIVVCLNEHEDYDLFNLTIQSVLNHGIELLQLSATMFIHVHDRPYKFVRVPYKAALKTIQPLHRQRTLFNLEEAHSEFVVDASDQDGE